MTRVTIPMDFIFEIKGDLEAGLKKAKAQIDTDMNVYWQFHEPAAILKEIKVYQHEVK